MKSNNKNDTLKLTISKKEMLDMWNKTDESYLKYMKPMWFAIIFMNIIFIAIMFSCWYAFILIWGLKDPQFDFQVESIRFAIVCGAIFTSKSFLDNLFVDINQVKRYNKTKKQFKARKAEMARLVKLEKEKKKSGK